MNSKVKYSIKNDIQHVLDCSDVYIGDTQSTTRKEYVYSEELNKIIHQSISSPEALVRIFVEVLTNAVDNVERSKDSVTQCKSIKVDLDLKTGLTSVWNDGQIIPIMKNKDHHKQIGSKDEDSEFLNEEDKQRLKKLNELYIHSLIFGHFKSSSNYDGQKIQVSGKNGVGVKCTNIFSSYFCVTGTDPNRKLKLTQEWTNNMTKCTEPNITTYKSTSIGYTEIKYIPDFKRLNLSKYPKEIYSIFKKFVCGKRALTSMTNFLNIE